MKVFAVIVAVLVLVVLAAWLKLFQRAPGHRAILMNVNLGAQSRAAAELVASIKVPTLILWGESDPLIEPAAAHKFASAIPGAKLII